jgi:hypothetical protein
MAKRLVALLFIFVIAGQVSAGVCGCIGSGNKPKHSCCKRKKATADAIGAKGCCGVNCMVPQSGKLVQDRTGSAPEIKFQTVRNSFQAVTVGFTRITPHATIALTPFANHRLKHPRPPDLFLLHRAFLI